MVIDMQNLEVIHYPNLKTVLMVEDTLKKANRLLTREQLKKKLPTKQKQSSPYICTDRLRR